MVPSCVLTLCGTFRQMCLTSVRHDGRPVGVFAEVSSGMTVRSIRARPFRVEIDLTGGLARTVSPHGATREPPPPYQ